MSKIHMLRKALWHLRQGGVSQLQEWSRRSKTEKLNRVGLRNRDRFEYYPAEPLERPKRFPDLNVGVILDDFSFQAFAPEWNQFELTRNWNSQLDSLDLVFIESAWNGNHGKWQYQLTGESGVKDDFKNLLADCRNRGIPTVFWNKEDPPHFEDFIEAASLFDYVFTSDSRLIPEYTKRLGHERVGTLMFAAQPSIHNPVRPAGERIADGVAFAGMYFAHKFPERRKQMEWLLPAAKRAAEKTRERFAIFSRQLGKDPKYQFPSPIDASVVGSLPYDEMLTAYKDFKVFLNVNSVVDSPSMCARRIFELTACGTSVVTASSEATRQTFPPNEIFQPAHEEEAFHTTRALLRSHELRDRSVHLAQRRVWENHTYARRATDIVRAAGVSTSDTLQHKVSVLASTNRPGQLSHLFSQVGKQTVNPELVLITHGFTPSPEQIDELAQSNGIAEVVHRVADTDLTLGECLNAAIDLATGTVLAKMDDDDLYGEHYLEDALHALMYSGADIVGKYAHYLHLRKEKVTILQSAEKEHKFTNLVMGATMVGSRDTFDTLRFAKRASGEDTDFQTRLLAKGGKIYSADRFNFVQMRNESHAHTWSVSSAELLGSGVVHSYGLPSDHYFF
ncbi:MAG: glycosyltransferase [Brevibacterium sp. UMB1308B]|nr:glycosyltransferase [Brevibacterium sp. UMB1308B]